MMAEDRLAQSTKSTAHPLQAIVLRGNELRGLFGTFSQITKKGGKGSEKFNSKVMSSMSKMDKRQDLMKLMFSGQTFISLPRPLSPLSPWCHSAPSKISPTVNNLLLPNRQTNTKHEKSRVKGKALQGSSHDGERSPHIATNPIPFKICHLWRECLHGKFSPLSDGFFFTSPMCPYVRMDKRMMTATVKRDYHHKACGPCRPGGRVPREYPYHHPAAPGHQLCSTDMEGNRHTYVGC